MAVKGGFGFGGSNNNYFNTEENTYTETKVGTGKNTDLMGIITSGFSKAGDLLKKFNVDLPTASPIQSLIQKAKTNDVNAIIQLHKIYAEGTMEGVAEDMEQAFFWARLAADLGSAEGYYLTGVCYLCGAGVTKDARKAWAFFEKSARMGHSEGMKEYEELTQALIEFYQDPAERDLQSLRMFIPKEQFRDLRFKHNMYLANYQDQDALNAVGNAYYDGDGIDQDYIRATYWFKRAVERDNPFSYYTLGAMYEQGKGVLRDYDEAIRLYKIAGQRGHTIAQNRWKILQDRQMLTPQNQVRMAVNMTMIGGDYDMVEFSLFFMYYQLAAQRGDLNACNVLGHAYLDEKGTKRDCDEGRFYLGKSILYREEAECSYMYMTLARLYYFGDGVKQDREKALQFACRTKDGKEKKWKLHPELFYSYVENNKPEEKSFTDNLGHCICVEENLQKAIELLRRCKGGKYHWIYRAYLRGLILHEYNKEERGTYEKITSEVAQRVANKYRGTSNDMVSQEIESYLSGGSL